MPNYIITESRFINFVANYISKEFINSKSEYDDEGYVYYKSGQRHLFTVDDTTNQILIDDEFYHSVQMLFSLDKESLDFLLKEVIDEFLGGDYIYNFPYGYED